MNRHLTRLYKAITHLGISHGSSVYFDYLFHRLVPRRKWEAKQAHLPKMSAPIWLRPGVSDWIVMERIFLDREYDPISKVHDDAMDRLEQSIVASGKIPLIIDCGANIGLSSVWFSERFPHATIISLEPEPDNYRILCLNAQNFSNITPIHAAVSDRDCRLSLSNDGDTPWAWETRETASGEVQARTVSELLSLNDKYCLMLVKVDIEGFEVNLFRSDTEWVRNLPLLVFEMHDWRSPWSGSGHAFFSTLAQEKRDYLVLGENIFSYSHDALR